MLGMHIVQLFVQYAPYDVHPSVGSWSDPAFKNAFADRVCAIVLSTLVGIVISMTGLVAGIPLTIDKKKKLTSEYE